MADDDDDEEAYTHNHIPEAYPEAVFEEILGRMPLPIWDDDVIPIPLLSSSSSSFINNNMNNGEIETTHFSFLQQHISNESAEAEAEAEAMYCLELEHENAMAMPGNGNTNETGNGNTNNGNGNNGNGVILGIGGGGEEEDRITITKAKREEHNAKERQRRMKLNQTYLSLRSLLPNSRRSKKRWSSTIIIDKALDYIPTLEKEIEKLNEEKEKLLLVNNNDNHHVHVNVNVLEKNKKKKFKKKQSEEIENKDQNGTNAAVFTVSIHQIRRGEVIIQICIQKITKQSEEILFSNLIHNVELAKGMQIISASAISLSDHHQTLTCHLHILMNESCNLLDLADYESILREKVISWLHH